MTAWPTELPPLLAQLHQLDFYEVVDDEDEAYDDEAMGMDFEP